MGSGDTARRRRDLLGTVSLAAELRRLRGTVEKIGTSRVHVLPVHEGQDASRALGAIATASLETELAQLQAEIAAFVSIQADCRPWQNGSTLATIPP